MQMEKDHLQYQKHRAKEIKEILPKNMILALIHTILPFQLRFFLQNFDTSIVMYKLNPE
jgi:hypothetical protein